MPLKRTLFILLTLIASLANTATAATSTSNRLSFDNWVKIVKKQAQSQGISTNTIENAFSSVQQIQSDKELKNSPPIDQFLDYSLANEKIISNKQLVTYYSDVLFEIKHLFGVNPEVIIALWGMDNTLGKNTERLSAIDVLTSLSYKQPANKHVKNELFQALKIIDEGLASNHQLKSDFSGRLGATPFKPTTFRDYAVDYDGDGQFDVWKNHADIFASTANYLSSIGWKTGEPWGIEVKLPVNFNPEFSGLNQQRKTIQWQDLGVRMPDGSDLPDMMPQMSSIISSNTAIPKTYLVFNNYFTLLRWKRSQQFAFAVGMMVDEIKKPSNAEPPIPFADLSQ